MLDRDHLRARCCGALRQRSQYAFTVAHIGMGQWWLEVMPDYAAWKMRRKIGEMSEEQQYVSAHACKSLRLVPSPLRRLVQVVMLSALAGSASAFDPDDPPSLAEMLADQAKGLGEGLDQRNRLKAERQQNIAKLERQLAECGACPERARIVSALEYWRETDRVVKAAERAALAHMGLSQYGSIEELGVGMLKGIEQGGRQIEAERERSQDIAYIREMVKHQCEQRQRALRPPQCATVPLTRSQREAAAQAVQACERDNDPLRLYANDRMLRQMCQQQADAMHCVNRNSLVLRARAYSQQAFMHDALADRQQKDAQQAMAEAEGQTREQRRSEHQANRRLSAEERRVRQQAAMQERKAAAQSSRQLRLECQQH